MKLLRNFLFLILFAFSCDNENDTLGMLSELNSIEKQTQFLEMIYDRDQGIRKQSRNIENEHERESKEYDEQIYKYRNTDMTNLELIEAYLDKYGHPTIKMHSQKATGTPILVVHHASEIKPRLKYFDPFYKAYKKGDIDGGMFTFYLGRLYRMTFNERMDIRGAYTEEFQVDTLLKELKLGKYKID